MVKEQYVNVDTAKLLKERGFDSNECIAVYTELIPNEMELFIDDNILDYGIEDYMEGTFGEEWWRQPYYLAPTQAMAMQWLREIKAIFFEARLCIGEMTDKGLYQLEIFEKTEPDEYTHKGFVYGNTYEEACENFIIYCLEHVL